MIHFITQRYNFSSIRPRHSANHIFLRTFRKESEQGRNGNNLHRQHLKLKNLLIHKSRARSISLFLFIYEGWQNVANRRKWKSFVDFRHFTPPVSWAYREAQSWEIWNVNKRSNVNAKCINSRFFFSARDFRESEEKKLNLLVAGNFSISIRRAWHCSHGRKPSSIDWLPFAYLLSSFNLRFARTLMERCANKFVSFELYRRVYWKP